MLRLSPVDHVRDPSSLLSEWILRQVFLRGLREHREAENRVQLGLASVVKVVLPCASTSSELRLFVVPLSSESHSRMDPQTTSAPNFMIAQMCDEI